MNPELDISDSGYKISLLHSGLTMHKMFSSRQEIRTSTSSMTSVPKPLKFLRPHYGTLKAYYETMGDTDLKVHFVWLEIAPVVMSLMKTKGVTLF